MAFKRVAGSDRGSEKGVISSLAIAKGDLLAYSRTAGTIIKATSATLVEAVAGVCVTATTTSDTEVLFEKIFPGDKYIVDTTNNTVVANRYQLMVLTDQATVNNTGTTATIGAMFRQDEVVGALADKLIYGEIILATSA